MLVVRVELWRWGLEQCRTTLATGLIYNDGTGDREHGNYRALFSNDRGPHEDNPYDLWRGIGVKLDGEVNDFPRLERGAWDLSYLALDNAIEEARGV